MGSFLGSRKPDERRGPMAGEEEGGNRVDVTFEVTVTLGVNAPIPDEHDMREVLRRMVPEIDDAHGVKVERLG
jgi:hypothetical protein